MTRARTGDRVLVTSCRRSEDGQIDLRDREHGPHGGERVELDQETLGQRVDVTEAAPPWINLDAGGYKAALTPCLLPD